MHRYNNKYGYGQILREYCQVPEGTPIWGEVQHSLFMNTRYISADGRIGPPREQLARFPRLLSWQTILPFPHQIPIGMPFGYLLKMHQRRFELPPEFDDLRGQKFTLVMPRMDNDLPLGVRIDRYEELINGSLSSGRNPLIVVAPHPSELKNKTELERRFSNRAVLLWRGKADPLQESLWSLALMQHAEELWSDYFGAHAFQAVAFFETPTLIFGTNAFRSNYHPNITGHLKAFEEAAGDVETQAEIAREVLGLQHLREPSELRKILGFTGVKRLAGKPIKFAYRKYRQRKVHRRQAAGSQSVQ